MNNINSALRLRVGSSLALVAVAVTPSYANIVINPTFDTSITSNPNAVRIENTIHNVIALYQSKLKNNISVNIFFANINTGLGSTGTTLFTDSYADYRARLQAQQTSASDATALAHLPNQINDPVTGHPNIFLTTANAKAIGLSSSNPFDGGIGLNTSICNLDRTTFDPNKFDLFAVVAHEIDEVLGTGSLVGFGGSNNANIEPEDLFRYDKKGNRTFTTDPNVRAYFSIDGDNKIAEFNQDSGGDYGDWRGGNIHQVQDAFMVPGFIENPGIPEYTALDVIGYNLQTSILTPVHSSLSAVPEPTSMTVLGLGVIALFRRRKA